MCCCCRKDINLVPYELQKARVRRSAGYCTKLVIFSLIFICAANLVLHAMVYGYLAYTNMMARREIGNLQQVYEIDRDATMREEFFDRRVTQLEQLRGKELKLVSYLERMETVLPADVASRGIDIDDNGGVRIRASATNVVVAGDALNVLITNQLVLNARLENFEYETGRVNFEIVGTMGI